MTSKIKENLLFYLASTREKSRSIAIGHSLELKNDLIIKLLIKNCRFKFDLLLVDGLRSTYSQYKFENLHSLFDHADETTTFDQQIDEIEKTIQNVYPDSCLIVDSINLLLLNWDPVRLNRFVNHLLSKYCKLIVLFNSDLIDFDYLTKIEELCSSCFELNRGSHSNEIHVNSIYKKKCSKLGLNLARGDYMFTFDSTSLLAKLVENRKASNKNQTTADYSYDLSFNLTIDDNDKQREQTVLPFMRLAFISIAF